MKRRDFVRGMMFAGTLPVTLPAWASTPRIKFRELYVRGNMLTEKAKSLVGHDVEMLGYMAPPLKPEIDFFVLTKMPMSTCPFCESEAQWPDDLVVALSRQPVSIVRYTDPIKVKGRLEAGFKKDDATGFVSFVRLIDVTYEKI